MAPYLFWELLILIVGVWLIAVLFFVYGWILIKRQRQMIQELYNRLPREVLTALAYTDSEPCEAEIEHKELKNNPMEEQEPIHIEISKDEPISKYENMNLDQSMDVSFIDEDQ